MAPIPGRDLSIEQTAEYDNFIAELITYHERRGTTSTFDPQPKIGNRPIDLYKLYQVVTERGGYDRVSGEKLAWRVVGQDCGLGSGQTISALAFNLKTVYYKNLAAYEISTFHGRDPPPKEILEEVTAKGGDLLNRTVENYRPPSSRESGNLANGHDTDSGDELNRTPKEDKMEIDEPGSGGGRTLRGLRQQPAPRVLFQPDTGPSRPARQIVNANSPQPLSASSSSYINPSSNPNSAAFVIGNWEGTPRPHPLTMQAVVTPGNNPELFKQRKLQEQLLNERRTAVPIRGVVYPRPKIPQFLGPNIYIRCLHGLRSGSPQEQDFALHHLVKISHERGDKFKFESFPGLVDGLVEKALEIASLFYDVEWKIVYDPDSMTGPNFLNGTMVWGTPDILARINSHKRLVPEDDLRSREFMDRLKNCNECALVMRNMVLLEDNANHMSQFSIVIDLLVIALTLPRDPMIDEFQHYLLEVTEQLTKYWDLPSDHPLPTALIGMLERNDRGVCLVALHSLNRIAMTLAGSFRPSNVPMTTMQLICNWIHLDDEELVGAALDFLYQYTAYPENIDELLKKSRILTDMIPRLVSLLMYQARRVEQKAPIPTSVVKRDIDGIPPFPTELIGEIGKLDEKERSTKWLQCCFEENKEEEITQIALWQAYQTCFSGFGAALLQASDFIKNVSNTFSGANAQVINGPTPRFIIKGIKPRKMPLTMDGQVYDRCLWTVNGKTCDKSFVTGKPLLHHIAKDHLDVPQNDAGNYMNTRADKPKYGCRWAGCGHHLSTNPQHHAVPVLRHINLHLLPLDIPEWARGQPSVTKTDVMYVTQTDEKRHSVGLPLTAILTLRNVARNIIKLNQGLDRQQLLFYPQMQRLTFVTAHNLALAEYTSDLLYMIRGMDKTKQDE